MKISISLSRDLGGLFDEEITFLQQIGVCNVDLYPSFLSAFDADLQYLQKVQKIVKKIHKSGLKVHVLNFDTLDALMRKPTGEKQLDVACELIKYSGTASIPFLRLWPQGPRRGPSMVPGRFRKAHRGGYMMDAFSLELMRAELAKQDVTARWAHHFTETLALEQYYANLVHVLQRLVPVAEDAGVKLMMHFDDPPVPNSEGLLPGITNPELINRVFEAVPSKNVGLLFCCGTRYESGVDIFEQIRCFGKLGKIFHVHFRNVCGTIPSTGGYEEVALDDGDMEMLEVLKALKAVGYDGAVNPDHLPILIGDEKRRAGLAFAVGYIKALFSAL
jgi:mannonate dehydratase